MVCIIPSPTGNNVYYNLSITQCESMYGCTKDYSSVSGNNTQDCAEDVLPRDTTPKSHIIMRQYCPHTVRQGIRPNMLDVTARMYAT